MNEEVLKAQAIELSKQIEQLKADNKALEANIRAKAEKENEEKTALLDKSIADSVLFNPKDFALRQRRTIMRTWHIYLGDKWLDTVFYTMGCNRDYVLNSLIRHDGFPENIRIFEGENVKR